VTLILEDQVRQLDRQLGVTAAEAVVNLAGESLDAVAGRPPEGSSSAAASPTEAIVKAMSASRTSLRLPQRIASGVRRHGMSADRRLRRQLGLPGFRLRRVEAAAHGRRVEDAGRTDPIGLVLDSVGRTAEVASPSAVCRRRVGSGQQYWLDHRETGRVWWLGDRHVAVKGPLNATAPTPHNREFTKLRRHSTVPHCTGPDSDGMLPAKWRTRDPQRQRAFLRDDDDGFEFRYPDIARLGEIFRD